MADGSVIINIEGNDSGFKSKLSSAGETAKGILKGVGTAAAAVTAAAGAALVSIGSQAISAYADYEQLVGGVETLFGTNGQTVREYCQGVGEASAETVQQYQNLKLAQAIVMSNAEDAYKNVGLSANEYMETVTSFAASLKQSLGGDSVAAAKKADLAISDMADNASKMGSTVESIQNAYQGFAKQNYTMLDNLKLGYGGTKEEMQRLLADAQAISGIEYDISSYADVVDAIHVIQTEMGIAGNAADEAATTISGSLSSMKAAWQNLLTGLADPSADIGALVENLVGTVTTFGQNIIPVITGLLPTISSAITQLVAALVPQIPTVLQTLLPALLTGVTGLITPIVEVLPTLLSTIMTTLVAMGPTIITTLVTGIGAALPELISCGAQMILQLATGLAEALPELYPQAVEIVSSIVIALLENVDLLVQAAVSLISGLAQGCMNALPVLVAKAPEIISALCGAIVSLCSGLIQAGLSMVTAIVNGIDTFLPQLAAKGREVISTIKGAISGKISALIDAGKNIVNGLLSGIKSAWSTITSWISNAVNGIVSTVKGLFGINSPSKVFAEIGGYVVKGFNKGLTSTGKTTNKVVSDWANSALKGTDGLSAQLQAAVTGDISSISARASAGIGSESAREIITNNNTVREKVVRVEGDGITDDLVRLLNLRLKAEDRRTGTALVTG